MGDGQWKGFAPYRVLMELEGWSFYEDTSPLHSMDYFMTHDACPKGYQLEVEPGKGECSVMHWKHHRCQRCNTFPPEGLLAVYLLHKQDVHVSMNEWDAGEILDA
jgi:hypothetical protein